MTSKLIITRLGKHQGRANRLVGALKNKSCIYVSLNKTHKSIAKSLKSDRIDISKVYFIDCMDAKNCPHDVIHIPPNKLPLLSTAINSFIKQIPGDKTIVIDGLATLLIYNNENSVASFTKQIIGHATVNQVNTYALSPKTQGEELLNKVFTFFDKVERVCK